MKVLIEYLDVVDAARRALLDWETCHAAICGVNNGIPLITAKVFFIEIMSAWLRLSDDERYFLTMRFIEKGYRQSWAKDAARKYCLRKTEIYDRSNEALQHFARLLFW